MDGVVGRSRPDRRRRSGAYRRAPHGRRGPAPAPNARPVSSAARARPAAMRLARRPSSSSTEAMASAQAVRRRPGSRSSPAEPTHLRQRRRRRRQHRRADGHGLQHGRAEPLVAAREDQGVGAAQERLTVGVGHPAGPHHPVAQPPLVDGPPQRLLAQAGGPRSARAAARAGPAAGPARPAAGGGSCGGR